MNLLPRSCWQATLVQKRTKRNAVSKYCGRKDGRFIRYWQRKLSRICSKSPAGIAEEPYPVKQLASCTVKLCVQNVLTVMMIRCKINFVLYFRGFNKPWKYFYSENFQIYGTHAVKEWYKHVLYNHECHLIITLIIINLTSSAKLLLILLEIGNQLTKKRDCLLVKPSPKALHCTLVHCYYSSSALLNFTGLFAMDLAHEHSKWHVVQSTMWLW